MLVPLGRPGFVTGRSREVVKRGEAESREQSDVGACTVQLIEHTDAETIALGDGVMYEGEASAVPEVDEERLRRRNRDFRMLGTAGQRRG